MISTRPSPLIILSCLAILLVTIPSAPAQSETRRDRQRDQSLREELDRHRLEVDLDEHADETLQDIEFDYGGWVRSTHFHIRDNTEARTFRNHDIRLWANFVYQDTHQLYTRIYGNLTDYNSRDEYYYMEENDRDFPRLDEGYYYGDLGKAAGFDFDGSLRLKAGRQYVTVGQGLVLDVRGDGAALEFENEDFRINSFIVRSIASEDSYDRSYPDFGHSKNLFSGIELTEKVSETLEIYGYTVFLRDKRDPTRPLAPTQKFMYDSVYYGGGVRGQFGPQLIYHGEYSLQTGTSYPDASVERSTIDAFAYDMGVSYAFTDVEMEPTFSFQYTVGSGDSDMQTTVDTVLGNTAGTDNNTYFAYGYVDTGFAFFPLISNVEVTRIGLELLGCNDHDIFGDIEVGVNHFFYRKNKARGGISDRGHDPAQAGDHLGRETDFYLLWRPFSDLTVTAQFGIFTPDKDLFFDDKRRPFFSTGLVLYF